MVFVCARPAVVLRLQRKPDQDHHHQRPAFRDVGFRDELRCAANHRGRRAAGAGFPQLDRGADCRPVAAHRARRRRHRHRCHLRTRHPRYPGGVFATGRAVAGGHAGAGCAWQHQPGALARNGRRGGQGRSTQYGDPRWLFARLCARTRAIDKQRCCPTAFVQFAGAGRAVGRDGQWRAVAGVHGWPAGCCANGTAQPNGDRCAGRASDRRQRHRQDRAGPDNCIRLAAGCARVGRKLGRTQRAGLPHCRQRHHEFRLHASYRWCRRAASATWPLGPDGER